MKNAEKMFMAINNVDERLIDEAKDRVEKPVLIRVEKHLPFKEIIAFAACFVLLAAGVFALFKFRINAVEPDDSSVNTNSSVSNPEDPDISPQNKELLAILKDLTANAMEIDGIFTRLSDQGVEYRLKIAGAEDYTGSCYPIGDNRKTEPSGLFTVPQTLSELEQLLLTCFTERSVKYYMDDIADGHITTGSGGENVLVVDDSESWYKTFIEADGKLYRKSGRSISGKLDIDYTTAMITSKTDKLIKFKFLDNSGFLNYKEGVIILENGGWKLDFFHGEFVPEMPNEFTEEDLALQKVLKELSPGAVILHWWLYYSEQDTDNYEFVFPESKDQRPISYVKLPTGTFSDNGDKYPQSIDELKELMLKYFTRQTVEFYMKWANRAGITENSDGTYSVTLGTENADPVPCILEADGSIYLYRHGTDIYGSALPNTAKVVEKTNGSIKYSFINIHYIEHHRGFYQTFEKIKYERGGWKLEHSDSPLPKTSEINNEIPSDLGLTYRQLVEKRGELVSNTYKGVIFKNSTAVYGWKSEESGSFVTGDHTDPGGLPDAGGCNIIDGVKTSALLNEFYYPLTIDELCDRYGFELVSEQTEPGLPDGWSASFTHSIYENVTFTVKLRSSSSKIDGETLWYIVLNTDCKEAVPVSLPKLI